MQATLAEGILEALRIGIGFLWTGAWAIILGLVVTSLVQVYVSKERMAKVLGDGDLRGLTKATLFGAASSGCSFGAVAIGKGLFKKGAHAVNFLAFMFASTNLIVELGLMILVLLGWEFLLAELFDGLVLIAVMAGIVHLTLPETLFEDVREELGQRDHDAGITEDPTCGMEGRDEHSLVTDGGETLKFCSAGCMETHRQEVAAVVVGLYAVVRDDLVAAGTLASAVAGDVASPPSGEQSAAASGSNGGIDPEQRPQSRVLDLLPEDERRVLEPVLTSPGITQIELRDRSDVSKSKVSQTVSALEKRGLLYPERQGRTYRVYPSDGLEQDQR